MTRPASSFVPVAIGVDLDCLAHDTGEGHAERPARLETVAAAIAVAKTEGLATTDILPRLASREELALVHTPVHIEAVEAACAEQADLDPDTPVSIRSFECAQRAAGLAIDATRRVLDGDVRRAFVATRPPGHHAFVGRSSGFCLFNNAAIAARWAQRHHGVGRVAIIDFDVHHGNGTQAIFESDPSVLYVSTHMRPGYPGTGRASEVGVGQGHGGTLNCPLIPGTGDSVVTAFYDQVVGRVLDAFAPELILVSAGYDLMAGDPVGGLSVTAAGVGQIATRLIAAADRTAAGRVVFLLEGGYDLDNLSAGVSASLVALSQPTAASEPAAWDPLAFGPARAHLDAWRGAFTL